MSVLQLPQGDLVDLSQGEVCFAGDATASLLMPVNGHLLDFSRSDHAPVIAELLSLLAGPGTPAASPPAPQALPDPLTESEVRVLRYLPTHLTAREIAGQLHVSAHTVTTHMRHLYTKLGAHSRHEAVAQARALGLLSPSSRRLSRRTGTSDRPR
jgi:LuxR family maltose regulon positive regulatory protein